MKKPMCPEYCLFDPDEENEGLRKTCEMCYHADDVIYDQEIPAILAFGDHEYPILVIGTNNNKYYIKSLMSNGNYSTSMVHEDRVKWK